MEKSRGFAATALWAVALSLMFYGSIGPAHLEAAGGVLRGWGLFVAIVACVPTGWLLLDRLAVGHEITVEKIAEIVEAIHDGKTDISRLR